VGNTHGGVNDSVETPHCEDFVVRCDGVTDDRRAQAVEAKGEETAFVAEEPPRDPPEAAAKPDGEEDEGQMEEVLDAEELVAGFPGGAVERALGVEAVLGFTEFVGAEHDEPLHGEGKACEAIGEGAITVEVATGGEVTGERRRAFPHLAATFGVAVVLLGELLAVDDPEALGEKEDKEQRSKALGPADPDAGKLHAIDGWQ